MVYGVWCAACATYLSDIPILPEIAERITAAIKMFTVSEFSMFVRFVRRVWLFSSAASRLVFGWFAAVVNLDLDRFWRYHLLYFTLQPPHKTQTHSQSDRDRERGAVVRFSGAQCSLPFASYCFSFSSLRILLCPICSTKLNTITFSITHFYCFVRSVRVRFDKIIELH